MKRSRLLVGAVATGLAATVIPAPAYACDDVCDQPGNPGVTTPDTPDAHDAIQGAVQSVQLSSGLLRLNESIPILSGSSAASAPVVAPSAPAAGSGAAAAGSAEAALGSSAGSAAASAGTSAALSAPAVGSAAGSEAASAGTSALLSDPGLGSAAASAGTSAALSGPATSFIPDMTVAVGVPFSYQIPIAAGSSAPLLSGLPAGLSYDPYSGLISGVALSGPARICDVGVIGDDGSSLGSFSMSLSDDAVLGSAAGSSQLSSAGSAAGSSALSGGGSAAGLGSGAGSSGGLGSAALGSGGLGSGGGSSTAAGSAAFGGLLSSVAALAIGAGVLGALSAGSSDSGKGGGDDQDKPTAPDKPAENAPGGKGIPKNEGQGGGAPEGGTQPGGKGVPQQDGKGGGAPENNQTAVAAAPKQLANTGAADSINAFLLSLVAFAAGGSLLLAQRKRR